MNMKQFEKEILDLNYKNGKEFYDSSNYIEALRDLRNNLLRECDWTQVIDSQLSETKKNEWKKFRQELRDLPKTVNDLENPTWPNAPI